MIEIPRRKNWALENRHLVLVKLTAAIVDDVTIYDSFFILAT